MKTQLVSRNWLKDLKHTKKIKKKKHPDNMTQNMFPMMINLWKPTHMTEGMKKKNSIKKGGYLNQLSVIVHQIKYRVGSIRLRLECIWSGPISPNWNIYYTYWQLEWVDKATVTSHQHRYNGPNLGEFLITLHLLMNQYKRNEYQCQLIFCIVSEHGNDVRWWFFFPLK